MRLLTRALAALALLCAGLVGPQLAHAATPLVGVYVGPSCNVAAQQAPFRNLLGRTEDIDDLYIDFRYTPDVGIGNAAYGLGCYKGQVANVAVSVPLAFLQPSVGGYGLTKGAYTLADVAAGKLDPFFVAVAKDEVADGFSHAINRLGIEMSGGWNPWAAAGREATFVAAFCHVRTVMLAVAPGLTFDVNPATDTSASGEIPTCADEKGTDAYFQQYTAAGAKAEPAIWNNVLNGWWGLATVYNFHGDLPRAIPEYGIGGLGDDAQGEASALDFFIAQGVRWIGFWDSGSAYAGGAFSDGSHPGIALEFLKRFGPAALTPVLADSSVYTGTAYKVSAPAGYHALLAQLVNGDVEQLAWGDAVGQTLQATNLTAQAAAAAKAGAAVSTLTVTNSQGATATVAPNADGSAVIEVTFPTTAAHVTYDLKLSSPRKLAFATAAGGVLGGFWQGGRLMADFTWGTSGGAARVYVGAQ